MSFRLVYQTLVNFELPMRTDETNGVCFPTETKQVCLPVDQNIPFVVESEGIKYLLDSVEKDYDSITGHFWKAVYVSYNKLTFESKETP